MQVEEDEQRVKLERDRIALIENNNSTLNKEVTQSRDELKRLLHENTDLFKDNRDMKEQLRVLNDNLRRETELLLSRDRELTSLTSEN